MKRKLLNITLLLLFVSIAQAQDDPTVYISKNGLKYHRSDCIYLKKSKIPIKLSAVGERYSPCSRCNPPTIVSVKMPEVKNVNRDDSTTEKDKIYTNDDLSAYKYPSSSIESSDEKYFYEKEMGASKADKTIFVGPRGGRYHYSSSGKKVYEKRK